MNKTDARRLISDRGVTKYPKSYLVVLGKLLDTVYLKNWRTDNVEERRTRPVTVAKLAHITYQSIRSTERALHQLKKDGIIVANTDGTYTLIPECLMLNQSRYQLEQENVLTHRILNWIRMDAKRHPESEPAFSPGHTVCNCVQPFCSVVCPDRMA